MVAAALKVDRIDVAVPGEHTWTEDSLNRAIAERPDRDRWRLHRAEAGFVSGESSAVTELISGRRNRPVTNWVHTSASGVKGRPTLLSNAETYAQVAAAIFATQARQPLPGPANDPGTRLLTVTRAESIDVVEVPHGTPWTDVLTADELDRPVLIGGYHGTWAPSGSLSSGTVSADSLRDIGATLGAGIVIPLPLDMCPLTYTSNVLTYLAGESARQCGPCEFGLPDLVQAFRAGASTGSWNQTVGITQLVEGRGACAHPDGTARLARSAMAVFHAEAELHRSGDCSYVSVRSTAGQEGAR